MKEMNPRNPSPQAPQQPPQETMQIPVDGFNQVLEMLKIADPEFRESLLKRLALRDRELARTLRADLGL
jgi:hypothetical protein